MPSKIRRAIAAVKDHTSIGLTKIKNTTTSSSNNDSTNLEIAVLKATSHDDGPIDDRFVMDVIGYVSCRKNNAATCARAIGRRIGRTSNWVVALKSLMLVLRIFQDGDLYFPKEVLHAMKKGYKILNLSSFKDDSSSSSSSPWDFTAFVRTFALYLDERLDCIITGKLQLQRRIHYATTGSSSSSLEFLRRGINESPMRDMKPAVLIDRITFSLRLLDRAVATKPTGAAKSNRLVQTCLYAIVQESFDLYKDVSDGILLLLDGFFRLQYSSCVSAYQTCCKASKQFEKLCIFYELCKKIGVGRTSEYPSAQKIPEELLGTLLEFLKDQTSYPSGNGRSPGPRLLLRGPSRLKDNDEDDRSGSRSRRGMVQSDRVDRVSDYGSVCTSLEELISADAGTTPARSFDGDRFSDAVDNRSQLEDFFSTNDDASVKSEPNDPMNNSTMDLLSLDGGSPEQVIQKDKQVYTSAFDLFSLDGGSHEQIQNNVVDDPVLSWFSLDHGALEQVQKGQVESEGSTELGLSEGAKESWELALLETAASQSSQNHVVDHPADFLNGFDGASVSQHHYNPFLMDSVEIPAMDHPIHTSSVAATSANDDLFAAFSDHFSSNSGPVASAQLSKSYSTSFDSKGESFGTTFHANASNSTGISNGNPPVDLFADFGIRNSSPINISNSMSNAKSTPEFSADFSIGNGDLHGNVGYQAGFGSINGPMDRLPSFGNGEFQGDAGYQVGFGSINCHVNRQPSFGNGDPQGKTGSQAGFGSANGPINSLPCFDNSNPSSSGLTSSGPTFKASFHEGASHATALVPFEFGFDDPFQTGPKLQRAPTFHSKTSISQDQGTPHDEDDPFESFSFTPQAANAPLDQQNLQQQRELWLRNQNKIIENHLRQSMV
ncbi:hypothetical protein Drorol1_Dr00019427 [Drosera rotundifolia]